MFIRLSVDVKDAVAYIEHKARIILPYMENASREGARYFARYLKKKAFSGRPYLIRRTGRLAESIMTQKVYHESDTIVAPITIGKSRKANRYAHVHFDVTGHGKITTIRPKRARFLTIPLKRALDARGVPKMTARQLGRNSVVRFPYIGKIDRAGRFLPYFRLASQVKVPSRVNIPMFLERYKRTYARLVNNYLRKWAEE